MLNLLMSMISLLLNADGQTFTFINSAGWTKQENAAYAGRDADGRGRNATDGRAARVGLPPRRRGRVGGPRRTLPAAHLRRPQTRRAGRGRGLRSLSGGLHHAPAKHRLHRAALALAGLARHDRAPQDLARHPPRASLAPVRRRTRRRRRRDALAPRRRAAA